jgi:hypothetical protein
MLILGGIFASCEKEVSTPNTLEASKGTYIGVVQLSYQPVSGDGDVNYVCYRMNPDHQNWEEIGWTNRTKWADEGHKLSTNGTVPGQSYDYKMRAHTDEAGFSDYSPVVTGYAFKAEPPKITNIERNTVNNDLEITVTWSEPNDLSALQNLIETNYKLYRKEAGDYKDFQQVEHLQFISAPDEGQTEFTATDDQYGLETGKNYIYKVITYYEYDYTIVNGDYRTGEYEVEGDTIYNEDDGSNPTVDYSVSDLGQILSSTQGGIPQVKEKVIDGTVYMGAIKDAGATAYGKPALYRYSGSSWQQVWSTDPGVEYDNINFAVDASGYYVGGTGDSLSVFKWDGSIWSDNLTPGNLGQDDSPSQVSLANYNDELYMAIKQHPDYYLQVLKYNGSAWDTIGGDANGIITTESIFNVQIEHIDGTLYLSYVTDNSAHIKRLNSSEWSDILNWTREYIGDIELAQNGGDLYFIARSNALASYPGGAYKVTSTSSVENLIPAESQWFIDPLGLDIDSEGNVILASIKYESQDNIYPFINIYDGSSWKTMSDDFSTGIDPVAISAINTDIYYMYGNASSEDSNGNPTEIESKKYSK